jgi:hypothetical protein
MPSAAGAPGGAGTEDRALLFFADAARGRAGFHGGRIGGPAPTRNGPRTGTSGSSSPTLSTCTWRCPATPGTCSTCLPAPGGAVPSWSSARPSACRSSTSPPPCGTTAGAPSSAPSTNPARSAPPGRPSATPGWPRSSTSARRCRRHPVRRPPRPARPALPRRAKSMYLEVLGRLEPRLRPGALVVANNARRAPGYLDTCARTPATSRPASPRRTSRSPAHPVDARRTPPEGCAALRRGAWSGRRYQPTATGRRHLRPRWPAAGCLRPAGRSP